MNKKILFLLIFLFSCPHVQAKAKFKPTFGYSLEGFPRVKIKNDTSKDLACWVAIDGHKKKFRLPPFATSQWITVRDKRYTYKSFSNWCDFIDYHPEYRQYRNG